MQIAGIQKTTLVDFPGKIAATVFLRGCNFRCGFCHNPELVMPEKFLPLLAKEELFSFLESRLGKLQGVCITGGEPLLWGTTRELISHIKALGFAVKLDTNGSYPERLEEIIKDGDVDYIAMDIKVPLHNYEMVTKLKIKDQKSKLQFENQNDSDSHVIARSLPKQQATKQSDKEAIEQLNNLSNDLKAESSKLEADIMQSIDLIMSSGIEYEFRTTAVKPLHNPEDFKEIGQMIKGAKKYYIQNFVKSKHLLANNNFVPFTNAELNMALKNVRPYAEYALIR